MQSLPLSCDAAFSAAIDLARRPCTDGTRVDIISQIKAWVDEKDHMKVPPVYWFTGLAGLGKTTIAYDFNDAFIHFSIICTESGFIRLEILESHVRPHSINFTITIC